MEMSRLHKKFYKFLENSSEGIGGSIPFVSQDWSNTKAAYRFLSNDRASEKEILLISIKISTINFYYKACFNAKH